MSSMGVGKSAKIQFPWLHFWHPSSKERYTLDNPQGLPPTHLPEFWGGAKAGSLGCDTALKYRLLRLPRSVFQRYSVLLNPPLCPLWNNGWDFASWFMPYSQPLGRTKVKPHTERHVCFIFIRCLCDVKKSVSE